MKSLLICEDCGNKFIEGDECPCVLAKLRQDFLALPPVIVEPELGTGSVLERLLKQRGIGEDLEAFFAANISDIEDFSLLNLQKGKERLLKALTKKEKITIYGDYDVDGITATALAYNILSALGAEVNYYINDRFQAGFGINTAGVEEIAKWGTQLILTVDNGIAGNSAVTRAKELGMEVIVTDHHEPNAVLPDCLIIDPKQVGCASTYKDLTGVAVVFKLMYCLCEEKNCKNLALRNMDLVAFGTVCDCGKLLGENRVFVRNGLKLINWGEKTAIGFAAMKEVNQLKKEINAYHLGFVFGPQLNAEGRLEGSPLDGVKLLTTNDKEEALAIAQRLVGLNKKRQVLLEEQLETVEMLVDVRKAFIIIYLADLHEGIIGLLAGRLKERYARPVIVLTLDKDGNYKGSGRSACGYDLKAALDKVAKLLLKYGGHAEAAGLSISCENIMTVKNILETDAAMRISKEKIRKQIFLDVILSQEEIDIKLAEDLQLLEPFGQGFSKPKFLLKNIVAEGIVLMSEGKHTRFKSENCDFLCFNINNVFAKKVYDVIGFPTINEWQGRRSLQFIVEELLEKNEIFAGGLI
ncbi:MAG: single-stranded-DNA-specific exonuclease RecJ [Clostridia bacterium]